MFTIYRGHHFYFILFFFQIGDLKGPFGLFMVIMQLLRQKLKVLDALHGTGTGKLVLYALLLECKDINWHCTHNSLSTVITVQKH